ncbi:tetratricopeptide repeat protein [Fictibacillus sp. KU28468]|uniref:tetratricopeptide repeat protein n=1 Tax=Fictibacillus sp. KU28468 TaxID=2991053 RepID=UPI00223CDB99|nr:tetratricopeptide repeat protein [Fictibacillus sp. KU28468]UZJ77947.1 hypothetical protein OKX00_17560 [Fictibacillus sp. KU28468]
MILQTEKASEVIELLSRWNVSMRDRNLAVVEELNIEVQEQIDPATLDQQELLWHSLLEIRYTLIQKNFDDTAVLLQQLELLQRQLSPEMAFYYHFFKGVYAYSMNQYIEAVACYYEAERFMGSIEDKIEVAEFFYKAATAYYHSRKFLLSLSYAKLAKTTYEEVSKNDLRSADCENILGLCCLSLKQYEQAEEHFLDSLDIAEKFKDEELLNFIRYNLGFLYSEQNLSDIAIRHLSELYSKEFIPHKLSFLLAREYFKMEDKENGFFYLQQGMDVCSTIQNEEYIHHLQILNAQYSNLPSEEIEQVVTEHLKYFEEQQLWGFVQDYTEAIATILHHEKKFEKASTYFYQAYRAKTKIEEMGYLR